MTTREGRASVRHAARFDRLVTALYAAALAFGLALCSLAITGCAGGFHRGAMPGEPKEATYVEIDGVRLRVVDVGEGPAVVLVHGFASSLDIWGHVIAQLRPNHRVIALDLKGFGWTDRPAGDYSPAAQAKLILSYLDARGIERAAFVGHSWGASVALQLALLAPMRVTRLGLYDVWAFAEQLPSLSRWAQAGALGRALYALFYRERPDEKLAMAFHDPTLITEKLAEDVERAMARPGTVAAALAATRAMKYGALERRYREIKVPVLLLWGREDFVTTLEYGERLVKELPDARLEIYPRCGHMPMVEAPHPSTNDLVAFLAADLTTPATDPATATATDPATDAATDAAPAHEAQP